MIQTDKQSWTPEDGFLLEMSGIDKSFPGVHALQEVSLDLRRGEVLALLGENGAGKSTLMKVLGGAYHLDAGEIFIDGKLQKISSPVDSQRAGISIIYQEFNLVPHLTVRENIFLGRENSRMGFVQAREEARIARKLFERIGIRIEPSARCSELTVAQQQCVEIAKALSQDARIIVMDEPSAALTNQEVDKLFAIIRDLRKQGLGIIYISHRLDEIFEVADRVMVMRDGQWVGTLPIQEITRPKMIEMMVGRTIEQEFPARKSNPGPVRVEVRGLTRGNAVKNVSFAVRQGEILALTGLVGAGRTETARLMFGADKPDSGDILIDGKPLRIRSPRDAISSGLCLLTEDRKAHGLVLGHSVRENFGLPNMGKFSVAGFIKGHAERDAFAHYIERLRIKVPHQEQAAGNLSGGNQQKVVLAKWLEANSDIVIFDEPTRGIDVGAKYEIYVLMNELAALGKAIIMISSELPEVLGMADRIIVMHEGQVTGEITDVASATQEQVLALAVR